MTLPENQKNKAIMTIEDLIAFINGHFDYVHEPNCVTNAREFLDELRMCGGTDDVVEAIKNGKRSKGGSYHLRKFERG